MRPFVIVFLMFFAAIAVIAQKQGARKHLFSENDIIQFKMIANYNRVIEDVDKNPQDHPAKIVYTDDDGARIKIEAELETRGNFRKNPDNCDFPPLEVDFDGDYGHTIFHGQKKLKLVTHCRDTLAGAEQNVLKEYLVYRLFNLLTDYSFRVRLCDITYRQAWSFKKRNKLGFLIEDNKDLAARHEAKELDEDDNYRPIDTLALFRTALFQYMIGNTDWSVVPLQNMEVIKKNDKETIPVPYDFDLSAFVHTIYAPKALFITPEEFSHRHYKGPKVTEELYEKVKEGFLSKQIEIIALVKDDKRLVSSEKDRLIHYLNAFFEELESNELRKKVLRDF